MIFKRVSSSAGDFESFRLLEEWTGHRPDPIFGRCPACGEEFYADRGASSIVMTATIANGGMQIDREPKEMPEEHFECAIRDLRGALRNECPQHGDLIGM